jgi:hypothetical protein
MFPAFTEFLKAIKTGVVPFGALCRIERDHLLMLIGLTAASH